MVVIVVNNTVLFGNDIVFEKLNFNVSFFISSATVDDWKIGEYKSFEFSNSTDIYSKFIVQDLSVNYRLKYAIGLKYEHNNKTKFNDYLPTDNYINGEVIAKYNIGWKIDPYFSLTTNTQLTESFLVNNGNKIASSNFRDPITVQEGLGFAYVILSSYSKKLEINFGINYKQIRAEKFTLLTDDRMTKDIVERYKTESGVQLKCDYFTIIDSTVQFKSKLDLFSNFEELTSWQINNENELQFKIWNLLGIVLKIDFFYNEKIKPKLFFKQSVRFGIITNF